MEVALCLSGQLRSIDLVLENLLKNIIVPNKSDVFCHTWHKYDNSKYCNFYNPSDNEYTYYGEYSFENIQKIIKNLNPISFEFEYPFIQENTKSMFYSIMKSNDLLNSYKKYKNKKYDVVIRSRYDIFFESELNLDDIDENTVYLSFRPGGCGGVNDCFAYGKPDVMELYSNLYDEYENTDRIKQLCPEGVLFEYLNNKKIYLKKAEVQYSVIRENGGMIKVN